MALGGLRASLLAGAALLIAGPAFAADLSGGSMKDAPAAVANAFAFTGYVQLTNDYIFRGISQNRRDVAVQGGLDFSYGMFYAGTFLSDVNFDSTAPGTVLLKASEEVDLYAGIKPKVGDITFDLGFITYNYLGKDVNHSLGTYDPFYLELKAAASVTVLKDVALSGTLYYSPDYGGEMGPALTVEGTVSKPIAKVGGVDWSASGTVGAVNFSDASAHGTANNDYVYGNLGVTGTIGMLSLDLRWWDTNLSTNKAPCGVDTSALQCGNAFAATAKFAF